METRKVKKCPFCGEYHSASSKFCGKTGKDIEFVDTVEVLVEDIGRDMGKEQVKEMKEEKGGEHVAEEEEEFKAEFIPVEGMEPGLPTEKRVEAGAPVLWKLAPPLLLILGFGLYFVLGVAEIMSMVALKTLCVFVEILAFGLGLSLAFSSYRKDEAAVTTGIISAVLALLVAGFLAFF